MFRPSTPSEVLPHGPSTGRHRAPPPRHVVARRQLPHGRPDLPARQPAAARAAAARAREAPAARPLGHVARAQLPVRPPEPGDPARRPRHDLRGRARARRPGAGGQRLPRGHLLGGLPGGEPRPGRAAAPVPPVLHARRHPEPRERADARVDPRGRRAGLRPGPRVRRGVRQPRPRRGLRGRRRRGRDRPARRVVEEHPLPEPRARRRGAPDPPPQRVQDQRAHRPRPAVPRRGARRCSTRTATTSTWSPATSPSRCTATSRRASTAASARSGRSRRAARTSALHRHAPLARDRVRHAEGLDGTRRGRRRARSRAPSAPTRCRWPTSARTREHLRLLEEWMRSYRPDELFDENGRPVPDLAALAPGGDRRMGSNPQANGGAPHPRPRPARLACLRRRRSRRPAPRARESTHQLGELLRDVYRANDATADFRLFCPDETNSNRLGAVFEADRPLPRRADRPRRRPRVARRSGHGGAQRAPLPRLARGLHAHRAATACSPPTRPSPWCRPR